MIIRKQTQYFKLMRLHHPIGLMLLLWPTLWALWLAGYGQPDDKILLIFVTGVFLMRSAGCVINDLADQHLDAYVTRTRNRPLTSGEVSSREAVLIAIVLVTCAFGLVLLCNALTVKLAFIGVALTLVYPFMKRFTYLPQWGLGFAFAWGIPMAFAAQKGTISLGGWFLYLTGIIWPVIYDTMYAMVDRDDDCKIGIKSTAILFNHMDKLIIGLLQTLFILMLVIVGLMFRLHALYYVSLVIVGILFIYQQWLIKTRDPERCFRGFLNNNWVGFVIFLGIALNYLYPQPY